MYDPDAHRYDCALGDVPMLRPVRPAPPAPLWGRVVETHNIDWEGAEVKITHGRTKERP